MKKGFSFPFLVLAFSLNLALVQVVYSNLYSTFHSTFIEFVAKVFFVNGQVCGGEFYFVFFFNSSFLIVNSSLFHRSCIQQRDFVPTMLPSTLLRAKQFPRLALIRQALSPY